MASKKKTLKVPKIVKKTSKNKSNKQLEKVELVDFDKLENFDSIKKIDEIKRDTLIIEIILSYPQLADELMQVGFHCFGCPASSFETLEEGCIAHGMNQEEIDTLIKNLNKKIKSLKK